MKRLLKSFGFTLFLMFFASFIVWIFTEGTENQKAVTGLSIIVISMTFVFYMTIFKED